MGEDNDNAVDQPNDPSDNENVAGDGSNDNDTAEDDVAGDELDDNAVAADEIVAGDAVDGELVDGASVADDALPHVGMDDGAVMDEIADVTDNGSVEEAIMNNIKNFLVTQKRNKIKYNNTGKTCCTYRMYIWC